MQKINLIARVLFSLLWIWIYSQTNKQTYEALAFRSYLNCIVLADLITWILFIPFNPENTVTNLCAGSIINVIVIVFMIINIKTVWPQSSEWMGMSIMVFMSFVGLKFLYYMLLRIHLEEKRKESWFNGDSFN